MVNKQLKVGNVPNLRFPGFKGEWEIKKLGEAGKFFSGGTPNTAIKNYYDGTIPFIRSGEINLNVSELRISDEGLKNSSAKMVNKGDILIALYGATSGEISISKIHGAINQAILCFETNENRQFFKNLWQRHIYKILQSYLQGGQGNLSAEIVKQLKFNFPQIDEQEKIAAFLGLIEERIETQNKIIEELRLLKNTLSKKIFLRQLNFTNGSGNEFSEWGLEKLGNISTITTGISNREDSIRDGKYTFFDRSQDIRTSNKYLFDKEAIIVPGEGQEFIPKYYTGRFDLHQRAYAIFDFVSITGKYLYFHILNDDRYLQSQAVGSTVKSLRLPMFQSMPIKLPCIEEQNKIANFLSSVDSKIYFEMQLLEKLKEQKKYFLINLFI